MTSKKLIEKFMTLSEEDKSKHLFIDDKNGPHFVFENNIITLQDLIKNTPTVVIDNSEPTPPPADTLPKS